MDLRPYQMDFVQNVEDGWTFFRRQLGVLPTGAGKTVCFAHLAKRTLPGRTLIIAHREELIQQAIAKLNSAVGIWADREQAGNRASLLSPVVVASIQTMKGKRLERWPADHFDLVVVDEAHHVMASSYKGVLNRFQSANLLGVTATADRADKKNLGECFDRLTCDISLFDLVKLGWLARPVIKAVPLKIDLNAVEVKRGDYDAEQLGHCIEKYLEPMACAIKEHAMFRKTLVFMPLIATSQKFESACLAAGLNCKHVDGTSEDRAEILQDFANGRYDILTNAMLLTEGYDEPSVDCVVVARPTRSRPLYSQMIGRGTRIHSAKKNLMILDFLWLHEKHDLIRPAHLVASSTEEADEMTSYAEAKGGGDDDGQDLFELQTETQRQREEKLRKELEANARKKAKTIDAMELAGTLGQPSLEDYAPRFDWEFADPTEPQRSFLVAHGIDLVTVQNKGHAAKLMDVIISRSRKGLATPKQVNFLKRHNFENAEKATFAEASRFITQKINPWRKDHD